MPMETVSALSHDLQPSSLLCDAARNKIPFQSGSLFIQVSYTIGKRFQPSKDRWEDLKPFIRRIYVEENRTLQQLAELLRDQHNFFPTDKQLTKRLHDWGFRKNVTRKKRIERIERKDYQRNKIEVRTPCKKAPPEYSMRLKKQNKRRSTAKCVSDSSSPVLWESPTSSTTPESQSLSPEESHIEGHIENFQSHGDREDQIIGSFSSFTPETLLSRLFVAAKIQPPSDISKLHLQSTDYGTKKIKRRYLSAMDILKLTTGNQPYDAYFTEAPQLSTWDIQMTTVQSFGNINGEAALRFPHMDVLFPSEIHVAPSPFMELYPFPIPSTKATQTGSTSKSRFLTFQKEISEYKDKFTKLGRLCQETHPAMISLMEKLGSSYYHLGKASQAEHWYRRVVTARQQTDEATSLGLLSAWLGVVDSTNAQGRFAEAKELHDKIHPLILSAVDSDHSIVQKSLQVIAMILGNLGNHEEAEEYCRQLVQIRLNTFGLRHGKTIAALQRLSNPIRRQERYSESEELLSIMVHLSESAPDMSDGRRCRGLSSLAKVLFQQGRYKASESLHRQAVERSKLSLGEEHPATMQSVYNLARTLRFQGRLRESEDLLQETVKKQTKVLGEFSPSTIDSMSELGETLEMAGRYGEASGMYEKALRGFSLIWGPGHDYTLVACESLGRCYEIQCRYTDALALYGRTIDNIQATDATNHEAIPEIHGWIHKACELWSSGNQ